MFKALGLIVGLTLICGCSKFSKKSDEVVGPSEKSVFSSDKKTIEDEQELKVAKLWARVDEIEEEVFRQKERMKLLEKGLLTGIAPEGLKKKTTSAPQVELEEPQALEIETPAVAKSVVDADAGQLTTEEQEKYLKQLEIARGFFTSARYGRAITEYERILSAYGARIDGGFIKYWIAKSWRQLKEYTTAEEILNGVLKDHNSSPWIPKVHYELAKVFIDANNLSSAREKLKFIKNNYPYEDVSEMASRELEDLPNKI